MTWKLLASTLLGGVILATSPALAADYVRSAPSVGVYAQPTVCNNTSVLGAINGNFDYRDRHYLHANLDVVNIYDIRETYERPADETHLVGRTYCEATAEMNDNRPRAVYYLIETTMGFAGIGDNVEYCVQGLDPGYVYGAHCSTVRHY